MYIVVGPPADLLKQLYSEYKYLQMWSGYCFGALALFSRISPGNL